MPAPDKEAEITINGHRLLPGQALTLQVALESFLAELASNPDALGADDTGRAIAAAYTRQGEALRPFFQGRKKGRPFGWRKTEPQLNGTERFAAAQAT